MRGKFETGTIVVSSQVCQIIGEDISFCEFVLESVRRFLSGDWGDVSEDDRTRNEQAVEDGERIFASYVKRGLTDEEKRCIWIITEADRSSTTVMFSDEY